MHFANFRSFDSNNYNVSWMFNKTTDSLHFMVEVRATGWIGFGVATRAPNSMNGYDVAVGGVLAGMGYLQVKHSGGLVIIELREKEPSLKKKKKKEKDRDKINGMGPSLDSTDEPSHELPRSGQRKI